MVPFILLFKIFLGKTASAARNLIQFFRQTEATTFAFYSVFILLLCRCPSHSNTMSLAFTILNIAILRYIFNFSLYYFQQWFVSSFGKVLLPKISFWHFPMHCKKILSWRSPMHCKKYVSGFLRCTVKIFFWYSLILRKQTEVWQFTEHRQKYRFGVLRYTGNQLTHTYVVVL